MSDGDCVVRMNHVGLSAANAGECSPSVYEHAADAILGFQGERHETGGTSLGLL